MTHLIFQAWDSDQTQSSIVDRLVVAAADIPIAAIMAEEQRFRDVMNCQNRTLIPDHVDFRWCEGKWVNSCMGEIESDPPFVVVDEAPVYDIEPQCVECGNIRLWWENCRDASMPTVQFRAYTGDGFSFYTAAIDLGILAEACHED